MNAQIRNLLTEAERLAPSERIELIELILESLDEPDAELDRRWANEARDRLEAYRRGELSARDFDEVLAKYDRP